MASPAASQPAWSFDELLGALDAAGLRFRQIIEGPDVRLVFSPRSLLTDDLRAGIRTWRPLLLILATAFDQATVRARAEVMCEQIVPHAAVPPLVVVPGLAPRPGYCDSCGEPLPPEHCSWVPRCLTCVTAMRLALALADMARTEEGESPCPRLP